MKRLLLVMGMVGCGGGKSQQDRIAELKKLGVGFLAPNEQGEPTQFAAAFVDGIDNTKLAYIKDMHYLEHILLQNTDIGDAGLVHLKNLSEVKTLFLNGTRVTEAGLVNLKGMTKLEVLQLPSSAKITDQGLVHLAGLTNLANLDVGGTAITDAGLVHLQSLKKLETLALPKRISNAALAELRKSIPNLLTARGGEPDSLPTQAADAPKWVERGGLTYEANSETPFTGVVVEKHESGQKMLEGTFKDGKKVSETKWDKEGNEIKK